jgi:hypothetical protein
MIYNKFNQYIKRNFFPQEKKGNTILFSVDEETISEFLQKENIKFSDFQVRISSELKTDWHSTNDYFFGICAIQVYIVSQMQEADNFSSNEYNPRLASFLDINTNKLQLLYRSYQDEIWYNLKSYCEKNDFQISIPNSSIGNRRYIKYPFSQALLSKEDLKRTPILFEKLGLKQIQYISFNEFSQLIEGADNGYCMNTHYKRVKEKLRSEFGSIEQLNRQIYNYFIDEWDGSYPQATNNNRPELSRNKKVQDLHIFLDKSFEKLSVLNDEYESINETYLQNANIFSFIEKYKSLCDDDFLIFKLDTISGESEYEQKFEIGEKYVIICQPKSKASIFIDSLCKIEQKSSNVYDIFVTNPLKKKSKHHFWYKYFSQQSKGYKIEGGIKLAYKTWMQGCGPTITCNEEALIWINGTKYEETIIDCSNFSIGVHKIVKDSSIEKIEIQTSSNIIIRDCIGWQIDKSNWNPAKSEFQLSGLIYNFQEEKNSSNITDWINLLNSRNIKKDYSSTVLKAIKRSNYGI